MTFGEKLQSLRQKAGMSQDALAERLGVSRQAISRWERDETMPEAEKVIALADLFGVTTDCLLRPEAAKAPKPDQISGQGRAVIERLGYLARTKGYLLGWVLIAWGAMDLLIVLTFLFGTGLLTKLFGGMTSVVMVTGVGLLVPVLYALVKIAAGVLVLKYGKRYADQVREENHE